ncbi:MAG: molybdenum cofactor guanylyltransferase [Mariprofundus sp.]|nr:molybdenum cofactor guanylyltransferase [Mariprofundus sp.]
MIDDCTVVILAGGESTRMGQDKASVELANEALLNRAIGNMQPLFARLLISVKEPKNNLLFPQICDQGAGQGPMMGIATALAQIDTRWLFVIACDMPFASADLIQAMAQKRGDERQVIVPMAHGVMQPLCAFYAKSCLPVLHAQIEKGERSLKQAIGRLDAIVLSENECRQYDSELLSFFDLDTMDDVARAEVVLKEKLNL